MTFYWDVIFHLGSTEPFVKLKTITKRQDCLGLLEWYNPIDIE